jgi:multidrug transporter EmrE-like cation transporter
VLEEREIRFVLRETRGSSRRLPVLLSVLMAGAGCWMLLASQEPLDLLIAGSYILFAGTHLLGTLLRPRPSRLQSPNYRWLGVTLTTVTIVAIGTAKATSGDEWMLIPTLVFVFATNALALSAWEVVRQQRARHPSPTHSL